MDVNVGETLGRALWHLGIYDLALSEALWRLAEPGQACADIGANQGYSCGLLAARVGPTGHVIGFEPHPVLFQNLSKTVAGWKKRHLEHLAPIDLYEIACGDFEGPMTLCIPDGFEQNTGLSFLKNARSGGGSFREVQVPVRKLDDIFTDSEAPTLWKVDVEGAEPLVFRGSERLLASGHVRDIIFEEHGHYPTESTRLLEKHGYTLSWVQKTFFGLKLAPITGTKPSEAWEPANILATLDPKRAKTIFKDRGWKVLGKA